MTCPDFRRAWERSLDARRAEPVLDDHASTCPTCRAFSARYLAMARALADWPEPPPPSPESLRKLRALRVPTVDAPAPAESVAATWAMPREAEIAPIGPAPALAIVEPPPVAPPRRPRRFALVATSMASAASIAAAWIGLGPDRAPLPEEPARSVAAKAPEPRPIGQALEEARAATIDLARAASGPAARLGLAALEFPADRRAAEASSSPSKPDAAPTPDPMGSFGRRFQSNVGPISGSARHAFGFLVGAGSEPDPSSGGGQ